MTNRYEKYDLALEQAAQWIIAQSAELTAEAAQMAMVKETKPVPDWRKESALERISRIKDLIEICEQRAKEA